MSADERQTTLEALGRGDEIAVAERLKARAIELADLLRNLPGDDRQLTEERVTELLNLASVSCESMLAISFPIVEYGEGATLVMLPRALRHVAAATAAVRTDQVARAVAVVPVVGRLVWALTAFAVSGDRLDALPALRRAQVVVPFSDHELRPVVSLMSLRYPDAFGGNAGRSFRDYYDWLGGLDLLPLYPLFVADLDAAFAEADLLLGMSAARYRGGIHAPGRDNASVRRLQARLADPRQRQQLDDFFPGNQTLEDRLEQAYAGVEGDRRAFDTAPARLFG